VKTGKNNYDELHIIGSFNVGLGFRFQITPIITPNKRTVQPGNAFEDVSFMPGFEIDEC
jgi:hypothetical protein